MAGITLSGTTTPNATVNIYRAARFAPFASGASKFPGVGQTAPANPDYTTTAAANGTWSQATTTQEDFYVATVDGSNKITYYIDQLFHPARPQSVALISCVGAPASVVGNPPQPTLCLQLDGAAGSRLWFFMAGTGWVPVPGA